MLATKILQLTDKNLDNFKHWGCDFNCVKQPGIVITKILSVDLYAKTYIHKYLYNCKFISGINTSIILKKMNLLLDMI